MNPNFIPLDAISTRRIDLDSIHIATPCRADWNAMSGDDQVRHCKSCAKNVYNLSALTRAQATRLIEEKEGHLCVQLHRREDGTLITADCTVGVSGFRKSRRAVGNFLVAAMAAVLSVFGVSTARAADSQPVRTPGASRMGDISPVRGEVAPLKNAPVVMGKPQVPVKAVTMGRISRPTTKVAKKHANHTFPSAAKSDGAPRHQRHR